MSSVHELLTSEEQRLLVELLRKLRGQDGSYPLPIFNELKWLVRWTSVVTVLYRIRRGCLSVWLQKRSLSDPDWGGAWHSAGKMVILGDKMPADTQERIRIDEHDNIQYVHEPLNFGRWFQNTRNGPQVLLAYYTYSKSAQQPGWGKFWPIDRLPKNMMSQDLALYANFAAYMLLYSMPVVMSSKISNQVSLAAIRLAKRATKVGFADQLVDI